jgi:hypothetical protein
MREVQQAKEKLQDIRQLRRLLQQEGHQSGPVKGLYQ